MSKLKRKEPKKDKKDDIVPAASQGTGETEGGPLVPGTNQSPPSAEETKSDKKKKLAVESKVDDPYEFVCAKCGHKLKVRSGEPINFRCSHCNHTRFVVRKKIKLGCVFCKAVVELEPGIQEFLHVCPGNRSALWHLFPIEE